MDTGGDTRLVEEHALELGIVGQVRQDGLDGDRLREAALAVQFVLDGIRASF